MASSAPTARDVARAVEKIGKDLAAMLDRRAKTRSGQQNTAVVCVDTTLGEYSQITRQPNGRILATIPVEIELPEDFTRDEVRSLRFVAFGALSHDDSKKGGDECKSR